MIRRTTLNLDIALLEDAERVLGTTQITETVHRALSEVVNRDKRRRLAALEIPDLTLESLEQSRRSRQVDSDDSPPFT